MGGYRIDFTDGEIAIHSHSVNISGRDFLRAGFVEWLVERMAKAELPYYLSGVKCLETERVIESPQAIKDIEALKIQGFSVALDDSDAGYSNINYLSRVPLDIIKPDRLLVNQIATDTASRVIARSIITMLKALNYTLIAEGVLPGWKPGFIKVSAALSPRVSVRGQVTEQPPDYLSAKKSAGS